MIADAGGGFGGRGGGMMFAGEYDIAAGMALATVGRLNDALAEFREAMRLAPDWPVPMDRAALLLAMRPGASPGQVREAVGLAARAAKLTGWKDPRALEVLAATYAADRRYDEAADAEQRAIELVSASGDQRLVAQMAAALGTYREHRMLPSMTVAGEEPVAP